MKGRYAQVRRLNRDRHSITDYDMYILSPLWKIQREKFLAKANYRCEKCGATSSLVGHHRDYSRLGWERETDVLILCEACHAKLHLREEGSVKGRFIGTILQYPLQAEENKIGDSALLRKIRTHKFNREISPEEREGLDYWALFHDVGDKNLKRENAYKESFIEYEFCQRCGRSSTLRLCKFCEWEENIFKHSMENEHL